MSIQLIDFDTTEAACQTTDPEVFFSQATEQLAKDICSDCPLINQCAEFALKNHIQDGVWGGMSEADRRLLRKNQIRSRKGIPNKKH